MATCVVVQRRPWGTTSYTECVADVFTADVLTISCTDDVWDQRWGPMQIFPPGTWEAATVYDDRGDPLYSFMSIQAQAEAGAHVTTGKEA